MRYVIAGFGKFGRLAYDRIGSAQPDSSFIVVESDPGKIPSLPNCSSINSDVTSFLLDNESMLSEDIVIPMVPFHLTATYVLAAGGHQTTALPPNIEARVPNPYLLNENTILCTKADFMCPDDCPEGETCTVTGLPRVPLYEELALLKSPDWTVFIQRSFQILPGVGGYPFRDLKNLMEKIRPGLNLIATACKCHGTVTAVKTRS
ncbi:hypothetical protein [Desulfomonile tiedjei]|uniref:RCK N-terminal domain-containing protein n=1 Tax=Desulfomonile tiedjei (strain ATCC 49306 / DSM 6799 / DCB-1) TaxID=706587 RepID=I4CAK3_DESTA|nr:hypothetical protein [Desulfomonile tiedjei]AFM26594.1 hypothetical protein Desti_3952 [Desulfomonile tiedjei DSM 6799]